MNKTVKYILSIFAAVLITAYLLIAYAFVDGKKQAVVCKNIKVIIDNGEDFPFLESEDIKSIVLNCGEKVIGKQIDKINTHKIKHVLSRNSAIKSINIFTTIDETLNVEIRQRHPVLRVQCTNARFYIDDSGYVFSLLPKPNLHVPIVTGTIPTAIANNYAGYIPKNEKFLTNLYEFAVFLQKNQFWNSMIEQINISNGKVELIPQIANHIVVLGNPENFNAKLNKLQKFYKNAMPAIGWDKYRIINIEYKNQIICKR